MSESASLLRPDGRFFRNEPPLPVVDAARLAQAQIVLSESEQRHISHVATIDRGGDGAAVFGANAKAFRDGLPGNPSFVITTAKATEAAQACFPDAAIAVSRNPKAAWAAIGRALHSSRFEPGTAGQGIHPDATIASSARIAASATIMAGAEIGEGASIGPYCLIGPGVTIGAHTELMCSVSITHAFIGRHCHFMSGVRVGEAGFGYTTDENPPSPVPQLGRVIIGDYVDVGANSTIDRGALDDTELGDGCKLDNLVQIAHNCKLGRGVVMASQSGISGSSVIGDGVLIGGQAGVADHLSVGDGAIISGKSGLMRDVPAGERWGGIPARPARQWLKDVAALSKLTTKG